MLKTQNEVLEYVIHAAENRVKRPFIKLMLLSIFAGMLIAFGAVGNLLVSSNLALTNPGLAKFVGATVFPVGLIGIVFLGLELFTSNCMMSLGVIEKKYSFLTMLKILSIVWFFNLIGCLIVAYVSYKTHTLSDEGLSLLEGIAKYKTHTSAYDLFIKGIMCNVLVCVGSLQGYIPKDGISKTFAIWFPIMLFVVLGYDHIVANMLYLPLAYMHSLDGVSLLGILYNFIFVTLGNFVGGAFTIALALWYVIKK